MATRRCEQDALWYTYFFTLFLSMIYLRCGILYGQNRETIRAFVKVNYSFVYVIAALSIEYVLAFRKSSTIVYVELG